MNITKLLALFLVLAPALSRGQAYSSANACAIRIITDKNTYELKSGSMEVRLNPAAQRFEFRIPVDSAKAAGDQAGTNLLRTMADGPGFITINTPLPDSRLDFTPFKGNGVLNLTGEVTIGHYFFKNNAAFRGLAVQGDNIMNFDLEMSLTNRANTLAMVDNERIQEIEIIARGDRILPLMSI